MRGQDSFASSSLHPQSYTHEQGSTDPNYSSCHNIRASLPQRFLTMNQDFTINLFAIDRRRHTAPSDHNNSFAFDYTQCSGNDQTSMQSPVYAMPGSTVRHIVNSHDSSAFVMGSPTCPGTPYSGTLSYPASDLVDIPPIPSPLQAVSSLSLPSMEAKSPLSDGYFFPSQIGHSFESHSQAQQHNILSPLLFESTRAPTHASSGIEIDFSQKMQWNMNRDQALTGISGGMMSPNTSFFAPCQEAQCSVSLTFGPGTVPSIQRTDSDASESNTSSSGFNSQQRSMETSKRHSENGRPNNLRPREPEKGATKVPSKTRKTPRKGVKKRQALRNIGPRPFCSFCNLNFKGMHELGRHLKRTHAKKSTKYRIVDSSTKGKYTTAPLHLPLQHCKNCVQGKLYNADYNAAAHLRRRHYMQPRPKKDKEMVAEGDRRGGKGTGSDPPMDFLRDYFLVDVLTFQDSRGVLHEIQVVSDDTSVAVESSSPGEEGDATVIEDEDAAVESDESASVKDSEASPPAVFDLELEEATHLVINARITQVGCLTDG